MPRNNTCYFVTDGHRYARLEDALSDAAKRSYETQKHTSVFIYAPSREAARNFGGDDAVRQFELNLTRGTAEDAPLASINIGASVSLWG